MLTDDARRLAMRQRAYAASRCMTWANTGQLYLATFEQGRRTRRFLEVVAELGQSAPPRERRPTPGLQAGHFLALCDDTGLFQHAVHSVPDRAHGYCVDDNARALLVACGLNAPGEHALPDARTAVLASSSSMPGTRRAGDSATL